LRRSKKGCTGQFSRRTKLDDFGVRSPQGTAAVVGKNAKGERNLVVVVFAHALLNRNFDSQRRLYMVTTAARWGNGFGNAVAVGQLVC
jgi:hypothetical protein